MRTPDRATLPDAGNDGGTREAPMTTRDRIEHALQELGDVHRLWILELAHEAPTSPKEAAERTGASLGTIAYHTRTLKLAGLLRKHHTKRVRGAIQTFYVTTARGTRLLEQLLGDETP